MYEQKAIPSKEKQGSLRLVASPQGGENNGAIKLYQDAEIYASELAAGETVERQLEKGRYAWLQVIRGAATLNGEQLKAGDGAAIAGEPRIEIAGKADKSEILLFDLA